MTLRNLYFIKPNFHTPHLVVGCGDTKYDLVDGRLSMGDHAKARAMLQAISPDGNGDYEVVRFVKGYNGRDYDAHDVMKKIPFAKKHSELFAFRGTHSYTAEMIADRTCEALGIDENNNSVDKIKLEKRPYQDEFIKKSNIAYCEFLLWAKCRAGKTTMVVRHIIVKKYKLSLLVSRRKSPFSSWEKDPSKYEGFENIRTLEVGPRGWKEKLASYMKQEGIQVILWGTIQKVKGIQDELKELYTPDFLAFDECHVGSKGKQWKKLRSLFSDTPCMRISGTAQDQIWEYSDEIVYAYSYWDEQLDNDKGVFNPRRPKMKVYTVQYMTEEYQKLFGNSPDAMQNIFAIEKDENGCDRFKYRTLVIDFINKYFNQRRIQDPNNRLFGNSQHILMSLPSVAACDLFAEMIPSEYATLVVTGKKGHDEESISKFIDENITSKTITLTFEANVLGVTEKRWDTIVNCKGGKDPKFWTQFAFRGGSGNEDWIVVDFSTKICLQTLRRDFALAQLKNPELATRTFTEFVIVGEWTESGFVQLSDKDISEIFKSDVGDTRGLMSSVGKKLDLDRLKDFDFDLRLTPSMKDISRKIEVAGKGNNKSNVVISGPQSSSIDDQLGAKGRTIDAILESIPLVLFFELADNNRVDTIDQVVCSSLYRSITGDKENIISRALDDGVISRQDFVYILTQCNDDIESAIQESYYDTLVKLQVSSGDHKPVPTLLVNKFIANKGDKVLVVGDPSGSLSAHLIHKRGVDPQDIVVYEEIEAHKCRISSVDSRITIIESLDNLVMKFTRIIGNPPYNAPSKSTGNTKWDKFIPKCLNLLEDGGTLSFITPGRWRQPEDRLSYIYKDYQLVSLEIYDIKDGKKTFNANTAYDVYTIKKVKPTEPTDILFSDGVRESIDVTNLPFIPNSKWEFWKECFNDSSDKYEFKWGYSHDSRLRHMSDDKSLTHIYPITHNFDRKGNLTFMYSSKRHEFQDHSKVLMRDQGRPFPVFDKGEYGCGRHTIFIPVKDKNEADVVIKFLKSSLYDSIRSSIVFGQRQVSPTPLNYIPQSYIKTHA